jgi:hypothetical protein
MCLAGEAAGMQAMVRRIFCAIVIPGPASQASQGQGAEIPTRCITPAACLVNGHCEHCYKTEKWISYVDHTSSCACL